VGEEATKRRMEGEEARRREEKEGEKGGKEEEEERLEVRLEEVRPFFSSRLDCLSGKYRHTINQKDD